MSDATVKRLKARRSIYSLNNTLPRHLTEDQITGIIKAAIRETPSSFNSQTVRAVIVYGAEHQKVWQAVKDAMAALKPPADQLKASYAKVDNCFASGAGTILFYDDVDTTKKLQEQMPLYAANFPVFAQQGAGMAQLSVWMALSQHRLGLTLQHYNELIETPMREAFNVPKSWKLVAQMPFGGIAKTPGPKTYLPDEGRFLVYGTSKL